MQGGEFQETRLVYFTNMSVRRGGLLFLPTVFGLALFFCQHPAAYAAGCEPSAPSASGYFFQATSTVEYSPDGYPTIHFSIEPRWSTGRSFTLSWHVLNDACESATVSDESFSLSLPPGTSLWSIRFASPSHFEIWDDANEVLVSSRDTLVVPPYSHIIFSGNIDRGASIFTAPAVPLKLGEEAPLLQESLPVPPGCPTGSASGYFFDPYERAEYVDGLLRVHLRLKSPYNDGRAFGSTAVGLDSSCVYPSFSIPVGETHLPAYLRYFSLRMVSSSHWGLWDDEKEEKLVCAGCEGDIPSTSSYVSWQAAIDGTASRLGTTPYPPTDTACVENCYSSVLFLPGLQASELFGSDGTRLWPPGLVHDNSRLALHPDGASREEGIYVGGITESVYGLDIYASFADTMDSLVRDGVIHEWTAYPYDWRRSVDEVVDTPTIREGGEEAYLVAEVERLAAASRTGKVTLVAHSNGGLVGKLLLTRLEALGKEDLVDTFIMVGTPQLGTPKALLTLLHGEGLPFNWFPFIFSQQESRDIGEHMPSAYGLLPSAEYFNQVIDPVAEFDPLSSLMAPFITAFGLGVSTYPEMKGFSLGVDGRGDPTSADVFTPNVLNEDLFERAESLHDVLDAWEPPSSVEVLQIVGWGVATVRGIEYTERDFSFFGCVTNCRYLDHEPLLTIDGDKTVVIESGATTSGRILYFDLQEFNKNKEDNINHLTLFESEPVRNLLERVLRNDSQSTSYIDSQLPTPELTTLPGLRIKVHSPVSLDIYDSEGRHTGIATSTLWGTPLISEEIPNSYYLEIGEGKYAGVPLHGGEIILRGSDEGTFTVEVEKVRGDSMLSATSFHGIPVVEGALVGLSVGENGDVGNVRMDIDADGILDAEVGPGEGLTPAELVAILQGMIRNLDLPEKKEKQLLKAVARVSKALEKEFKREWHKKVKTAVVLGRLQVQVKLYERLKILTRDEAAEIKGLIELLQKAMVQS